MKSPRTIDPSKLSASTKALNPHLFCAQSNGNPIPSPSEIKQVSGQHPRPVKVKKMTKPEIQMGMILLANKNAGTIKDFEFEGIKLKIGDDTCWYCCDYAVYENNGTITFIETKGPFLREDSLIKFKCAKHKFKQFKFELHQLTKEGWQQLL